MTQKVRPTYIGGKHCLVDESGEVLGVLETSQEEEPIVKKKTSIQEDVTRYAEEWRDEVLSRTGGGNHRSLRDYVHSFLSDQIRATLFAFMGIEQDSWGKVKILYDAKDTVVGQIQEEVKLLLAEEAKQILSKMTFILTEEERQKIANDIRKNLMYRIETSIKAEVDAAATKIAKDTLEHLLRDSEWIHLVEASLQEKK